jgi:hypothetical protein
MTSTERIPLNLNQSHAGTHMSLRSRACRFHLGFGLEQSRVDSQSSNTDSRLPDRGLQIGAHRASMSGKRWP